MKLPSENGEHIHSGVRLTLQKNGNVIAIHFNANGFFGGDGIGLMRGLFEHRREAEKFSVLRLVDHNFLMVFVNGGDLHVARDHDIGVSAGIANFVDALAGGKFSSST